MTVFVTDDVDLTVNKVRYVRWNNYDEVCHNITVDICIISRYINFFIHNVNYAKKTYLWLHDMCINPAYNGQSLPDSGIPLLRNVLPLIDRIVCVGKTQMNEILIDKIKIEPDKLCYIPNGINPDPNKDLNTLDKILRKKRKNSFIFCSSPDRYLTIVLRLFPKITEVLGSDTTLDIYYNTIPDECKILAQGQDNVTCHGKVAQDELLKIMEGIEYWFYPTKFFETCCTIAFETAYCGCLQITSNVGAMKENIKGIVIDSDPDSQEFEQKLLVHLEQLKQNPNLKRSIIERQYLWAREQTWDNRALAWQQLIETNNAKYIVANTFYEYHQQTAEPFYLIPYYIRKLYHSSRIPFTQKTAQSVRTECEWYDAFNTFIDSNEEYLAIEIKKLISIPMSEIFTKQTKCCFVIDDAPSSLNFTANEIRRKFAESTVVAEQPTALILNRKGVEMVLEQINLKGIVENIRSTIYNTFGANSRALIEAKTTFPKNMQLNEPLNNLNEPPPLIKKHKFTIGCAMMIKNEEKAIERSLNSVYKYVNCIIIYDTGSTDRTIEIVKQFCQRNSIPLHLKQDQKFIDFATSRNIMLKFADDKADYLLMLDSADELRNGREMYEIVARQPDKYIFNVSQLWHIREAASKYTNFRFIKTGHDIKYDYPVHEVLSGPFLRNELIGDMKSVILFQDRTVELYKSRTRWLRDKDLLVQERKKRPNDNRVLFYLGQTYKCLGINDLALATYKQRIAGGGYIDEVQQSYIDMYDIARTGAMSRTERLELLHELWDKHKRGEAAIYLALETYSAEPTDFEEVYKWATLAVESPKPTTQLWVNHELFDHKRYQILAIACCHHPEQKPEMLQKGFQALQCAIAYDSNNPDNQKLMKEYYNRGYV